MQIMQLERSQSRQCIAQLKITKLMQNFVTYVLRFNNRGLLLKIENTVLGQHLVVTLLERYSFSSVLFFLCFFKNKN